LQEEDKKKLIEELNSPKTPKSRVRSEELNKTWLNIQWSQKENFEKIQIFHIQIKSKHWSNLKAFEHGSH
jgi:hypothetical protein